MQIIEAVLVGVTVVYFIGSWSWLFHLSHKFNKLRGSSLALLAQAKAITMAEFATNPAKRAEHVDLLHRVDQYIAAMSLVNSDMGVMILWPIKLRGRWNADYLTEAVKAAEWPEEIHDVQNV